MMRHDAHPKRTVHLAAWLMLAATIGLQTGCVPSEPMAPGAMDALWNPDASLWSQAQVDPISLGEGKSLHRVEVAYEPSVVWSIIGLNHVVRDGPDADGILHLPVSEPHARATARLLEDLADKVQAVTAAAETADRNPDRWAGSVAELLGFVHGMTASLDPDIEARRRVRVDDTAAWVVLPLLEMLAGQDDAAETSLGEPAAGPGEDLRRVESKISRVALTIALRLAGRPMTVDLLDRILTIQRSRPAAEADEDTQSALQGYLARTPRRYPSLAATAKRASHAAGRMARGMKYLAALSAQWPKVNLLAIEMRRRQDSRIVSLEFDVRDGQTVELSDLHFAAPKVTFTGHGRVVVQSDSQDEAATTVVFESDDREGIGLHFDGIIYGFVRLLAFPLTDAHLRQVRYRPLRDPQTGASTRVVEVFMETVRAQGDRRRLIRVSTTSTPQFEPRAQLPPRLTGRTRRIELDFYNGQRRWFYTRKSFKRPELYR